MTETSVVATVGLLAIAGLLLIAAWRDVASRTIPNWIAVAVAVCGIAVRSADGLAGLATSGIAAVTVFAALLVVYMGGALGGGDVKLASALAIGLSPWDVYDFVLATAYSGGVLAVLYLLLRALPKLSYVPPGRGCLTRVYGVERWRIRRHGPLPYGVAIAFGGVFTLIHVIGR